jgi:hypothetical protein
MCERFLWLVCELSHTQDAIVQKGADGAQRMNGPSKMPAVMHKWVRAATTAGVQSGCQE